MSWWTSRPVTACQLAGFSFRSRSKQPKALDWAEVRTVDWRHRRILVRDLEGGRAAPGEALINTVLAKRDIMDALVVDVGSRQTMRANELWLREEHGQLWLGGADASPWAVIPAWGGGLLAAGLGGSRGGSFGGVD